MKNFTFPVLLSLIMFLGTNPVLADTNASVAAGDNHSLLLRTDGSLWSMGRNDRGQLGNGSELERGLVGWWKFDGDATDSSGNGNDGTVNGATLTTDRHGQANGAYSFDGVNDYIDFGDSEKFDNRESQSIFLWVKFLSYGGNTSASYSPVLTKWGNNHTSGSFFLSERGNGWTTSVSDLSSHTTLLADHNVSLGEWEQVGIVLNNGEFSIFVQGTLRSTDSSAISSIANSTTSLKAGAWYHLQNPSYATFNGSIDDIRIYDRALSSSEVSALYTLESSPPNYEPVKIVDENVTAIASGSETSYFIKNDGSLWGMGRNDRGQLGNAQGLDQGLVGWWKFDGGATDSSGNGNDGTVNGATLTTDRHGQANEAYSFDGVDDYLSMTIGTYDEVTFSAWLKIASFDNEYPKLFDLGSSYPLFRIGFNGNRSDHVSAGIVGQMLSLRSSFSAHNSNLSYGIQPIGSWINVVTSLGVNSFHSTFLDGILIEQGSYKDSPSLDGSLKIGVNNGLGSDHFFNGSIDDVRIYNRALSESEVSALYTLESQPFDQFSPIQIVDSNVTGVSSRGSHALFKKTDGSLWAMGANEYGQLGDGTTTDSHTPIQIVDENVTTFSAGGDHSRFVQADGSLWAMGRNHAGQIGDGTTTDRASPVKVVNSGVANVTSGLSHGYYLTTSGDLWAMGWNADGQLGDGTVTNRNTPVQVLNGSNVSKVSAGSKEGYFIKEDGTAWAMGRNDFGQLGNAETADQSTPEIIFGWKELAGHSQARYAYDGLEIIDGKLYFAGGSDGAARDTFERYDPSANQWTPLPSLNSARSGMIGAVLNDQFYAIGGSTLSSVEIYDPSANSWSFGNSLPEILYSGRAITLNGKILVFGGHDVSAEVSSVREYDPGTEEWTSKASMNTARHGHQIAVYNQKIWIMGGTDGSNYLSTVEIYDPATDSWSSGPNLTTPRHWAVAWVANGQLFIGGGSRSNPATYLDTIESYDPDSDSWSVVGSLPSTSYVGGVAVIEDKLFLLVGSTAAWAHSNKLYVSDMQAVREIRGNSSTGHTLLVKADNSFGAMGQNNYGQLGDNSLADKSYPVSLMNTYNVVMTSGTGGSATGAGMYYAGDEVTIGASPSPGYLFGNWSGDFSSTDANDSFIINADYAIAASFSQDTEDDDNDGLNNYYELAVLGSNPLSGDTDGDGFSDLDENTTGLDPTVANTALYNHLSNLVELARSEGNATGYQAGLSDGNASGILYVQNNKTLYELYTQEEASSSANERYADGVTEGNASGIAWASQNWSLYSLYTGEEKNASASTQYSLGLTEGNTSGYAQGLVDGNASGIAWGQANRTDYHFYTGGEVNSSAEAQYTLGYSEGNTTGYAQGLIDGNASGVNYAFEHRADYDLFTEQEINASALVQYNRGYAEGNGSGYEQGFAEGNASAIALGTLKPETANLFTEEENKITKQESVSRGYSSVQVDLATEGLSLKAYYERVKNLQVPHLSDWHYQPGLGWLWTDRKTFPFIYRAKSETHPGGWLYYSSRIEHRSFPFYVYARQTWTSIAESP